MAIEGIINNPEKRKKFIKEVNLIRYFKILGPGFHYDIMGVKHASNLFEIMYLLGSEKGSNNFQKVVIDDYYISYIPLGKIINNKLNIEYLMLLIYPWYKLANSIKNEGMKSPVILERNNDKFIVLEGRHRIGSSSLIEPYDKERKIPCLVVSIDEIYTLRMFKKSHPNPLVDLGFIQYDEK